MHTPIRTYIATCTRTYAHAHAHAHVYIHPYTNAHTQAATKLAPSLRHMPYPERLQKLNIPTLKDRRKRGDLITMYKGSRKMERVDREDLFSTEIGRTRGHEYKMKKERCLKDTKKNSFPYRTKETWNKLPKETVTAGTIHLFKERLDEYLKLLQYT